LDSFSHTHRTRWLLFEDLDLCCNHLVTTASTERENFKDTSTIMSPLLSSTTLLGVLLLSASSAVAFVPGRPLGRHRTTTTTRQQRRGDSASVVVAMAVKAKYDPKWKKQLTLAEQMERDGKSAGGASDVGLVGTVPVVFKQGNDTRTTTAIVGQPLSDVASQAGQYIKYGCGKGECGTCESLCNGKWVRPCTATVPADLAEGEELTIMVKTTKNKGGPSSGRFYSARSFLMGFYNNVLGMIGMVTWRKRANRNFEERIEFEDLVAQKTAQKKAARKAAAAAAAAAQKQ
jgi:ferredoxin